MKTYYDYVGSMIFGNWVDISDPCYERDGESNIIAYKIASGKYGCYIKYGRSEYCEENRIAEIKIVKKGHTDEVWDKIGVIGVDSGLAGFFNHKIEYSNSGWDDFCDRLAEGGEANWWVNFDNGFFSTSGWGDGVYDVYEYRENDKTVGLKIVFIQYDVDSEVI